MQRIRMSLPYFKNFGWDAEVVTVDPAFADIISDELLLKSVPDDIKIHLVKAVSKKWTLKFGLGSIALRSLFFYKRKVSGILSERKFDLVYFSTTQFPVCVLGNYWKKKIGIPYIIDMQDPWHSDYYNNKPKHEQPAKYWFSYRLNKYMEPIAMKSADGIIAVSESYISDLKARYPKIQSIPVAVIPFGAFELDQEIAAKNDTLFKPIINPDYVNVVYVGRGGADMSKAISTLFEAVKIGKGKESEMFKRLRLYFIGTSYAPEGQGKASVLPLAAQFGLSEMVIEVTNRISFYHTIVTLQEANALFIPGSDDPGYTASKIYPYLLTQKPLLAIFNSESPALNILKEYGAKFAYSYDNTENIDLKINEFLMGVLNGNIAKQTYNENSVKKYAAKNLTGDQCMLFDEVIKKNK